MKTIRDFLRKHALLLLAALVVLSVPTGVALGKYVASETVTDTLNLNVSMVTVEYTIDKNEMWKVIAALSSKPSEIKFVKHNAVPTGADRMDTYGIQASKSGEIGLYQSADKEIVYIAPADNCDNVMYAPVDSNSLFCAFAPTKLGLSNSLKTISFDNLDTSRVTDMGCMFMICRSLTSLDLSKLDTSNVTTMASMFSQCESLTSLDLSSLDTSKVKSMNNMFHNCVSLASLDLNRLNTSNVTDMDFMFEYCESLTKLDLSSFDTRKVTGMNMMFWMCKKLETIYVGSEFVTGQVTEFRDSVFGWCEKLKGENGTTYVASQNSSLDYARIDGGPTSRTPGYFSSKNASNTTNTVTFSDGTNGMIIS